MDALDRIVDNLVRQNVLLTYIVWLLLGLFAVAVARLASTWWRS